MSKRREWSLCVTRVRRAGRGTFPGAMVVYRFHSREAATDAAWCIRESRDVWGVELYHGKKFRGALDGYGG